MEEKMKSKIEKTEWKCPACGTTKITPWYVKELEPELEGIYPETVKKIIKKVGKMLNDNSQDQEENEPEKVYVDPIVPDFIAEKLAEERYNTREILLNGTKPLEVEDTPEEWEEELMEIIGEATDLDEITDFIKQLLEERVENVLEQIQDWLSSDKGGDMDDEYLNILIDDIEELKLNTKKEMKDFNPIEQERKFLIYFITILLLPILATYLMLILAVIL